MDGKGSKGGRGDGQGGWRVVSCGPDRYLHPFQ